MIRNTLITDEFSLGYCLEMQQIWPGSMLFTSSLPHNEDWRDNRVYTIVSKLSGVGGIKVDKSWAQPTLVSVCSHGMVVSQIWVVWRRRRIMRSCSQFPVWTRTTAALHTAACVPIFLQRWDLRYPESCCCHSESPSQTVKCCDFSLFVFLKTFANPIKLTVFEC